jgi:hypothetical protein
VTGVPHVRRRRAERRVVLAALGGILLAACTLVSAHRHGAAGHEQQQEQKAAWERRTGDGFENRGVAKVAQVGNRWALTVYCDGVHTIYLDETAIKPAEYQAAYVQARYHYVMRPGPEPRCVREPCIAAPERLIALDRVTRLTATKADAEAQSKHCTSGDGQP